MKFPCIFVNIFKIFVSSDRKSFLYFKIQREKKMQLARRLAFVNIQTKNIVLTSRINIINSLKSKQQNHFQKVTQWNELQQSAFNKSFIQQSRSISISKSSFVDSQQQQQESQTELITNSLKKEFNTDQVFVEDTSGGCGQSFRVTVQSKLFKGKSRVDQHR